MSNQTRDEIEYTRQVNEQINADISLGKDLAKLKSMPEFKRVFGILYVGNGKKFLWENIIHVEEELMMKRRDQVELDRGAKTLKGLRRQVDARLVFESFVNTLEDDAINAEEAKRENAADAERVE